MHWRHIDSWKAAIATLSLDVSGPDSVFLPTGTVEVDLLVKDFGGPRGIVVVSNYETVQPHVSALLANGYAYSTFEPPEHGKELSTEEVVDLLRDWTWTGVADAEPAWLRRR